MWRIPAPCRIPLVSLLLAGWPPGAYPVSAMCTLPPQPADSLKTVSRRAPLPPSAALLHAPSLNSALPDLVDCGGFAVQAGVGWDQSLQSRPDRHAITLGVTPLGIEQVVCRILGHHSGGIDHAGLWNRVAARM